VADDQSVSSKAQPALNVEGVEINEHCVGSRWATADIDQLARVVVMIAMGQATHAAHIISELRPLTPALNIQALRAAAKTRLSIAGKTAAQLDVSRYHRDGLLFEAISWVAAQQSTTGKALLRDPHLSSTTQGLDGLMIELDATGTGIACTTVFEDKCSEHPRTKFRDEIMPAFLAHHGNARGPDLLAAAAALLQRVGLNGTQSTEAAARVLDRKYRAYRASLALTNADESLKRRKALFKDYEELSGIDARRRIAGIFITAADLRGWFDKLASAATAYIDSLDAEDN
jgi:hypothetical protein